MADNRFEVNEFLQNIADQPAAEQLAGIAKQQDTLIADIIDIRRQIKAAYEQGNTENPRTADWLNRVHGALRVKRFQLERLAEVASKLRVNGEAQ